MKKTAEVTTRTPLESDETRCPTCGATTHQVRRVSVRVGADDEREVRQRLESSHGHVVSLELRSAFTAGNELVRVYIATLG